jgi:hypothetical protein
MSATDKELAKVVAAKEDLIVDENVLKLEIRRVRQALNQKADQVFTLEQRKVQLKAAMRERLEEIAIHKELVGRQLRDSQNDAASINRGACVRGYEFKLGSAHLGGMYRAEGAVWQDRPASKALRDYHLIDGIYRRRRGEDTGLFCSQTCARPRRTTTAGRIVRLCPQCVLGLLCVA